MHCSCIHAYVIAAVERSSDGNENENEKCSANSTVSGFTAIRCIAPYSETVIERVNFRINRKIPRRVQWKFGMLRIMSANRIAPCRRYLIFDHWIAKYRRTASEYATADGSAARS